MAEWCKAHFLLCSTITFTVHALTVVAFSYALENCKVKIRGYAFNMDDVEVDV